MLAIKTEGLTKYYGKSRGIEGVNLEIESGEVFGFIGPNGAGKSTTIKTLLNFIYPSAGTGSIFGLDIATYADAIKFSTGYVPSDVRYYPNLTCLELLKISQDFHEVKEAALIDDLCERFEIEKNKKFGQLSTGNKKKLAIAVALSGRPKLLILDEPTNGLDPLMQNRLFQLLKEKNEEGCTIFLSSHNLKEVQNHCTSIAFIKDGNIIDQGEVEFEEKSRREVMIQGEFLNIAKLESLGGEIVESKGGRVTFLYDGELKPLLAHLSTLDLVEISIGEQDLESKFMSYYERGEKE